MASIIEIPCILQRGESYSNNLSDTQKITVLTSALKTDYTMMLPSNMGVSGQFLKTTGQTALDWADTSLRQFTTAQRIAFGVENVTDVGTIVYDTDLLQTFLWTGTSWLSIAGSTSFVDNTFFITDDVDPTRIWGFQAGNITTGTTRILTMADRNMDLNTPQFSTIALIEPVGGVNTTTIGAASGSLLRSYTWPADYPAAGTRGVFESTDAGVINWTGSPILISPTIATSLIIRDPTPGANTITIAAPAGPTTHVLTLPGTLPVATTNGVLQATSAGITSWSGTPTVTGLFVQDPTPGANTISIIAPAGPTTHVLTLPGTLPAATTRGVLQSTDAGITSWTGSPTLISPTVSTSIKLFDPTPSAFGITINAPVLGADYPLTLPATLPVATTNGVLQSTDAGITSWSGTPQVTGLFIQDPTPGANTISIIAPAGPTTHVLTLPGTLPATGINSMLITTDTGITSWSNTVTDLGTAETVDSTGGLANADAASLTLSPTYTATAAGLVGTHRYMNINNVVLGGAGPATITDAAVMYFNAGIGTHEALDIGNTPVGQLHTTAAYLKIDINGTIHYIPVYTAAQIA
jgi:hypothetical protein